MKRGLTLTLEQANAHQVRHGFSPLIPVGSSQRTIKQNDSTGVLESQKRGMNQTEASFALVLQHRQQTGEILSFAYEGVRLKYADGLYYKPDFVVLNPDKSITLIEVKGGQIWSRDKVRFRACAAEWKDWFTFQLWQRKRGQWSQLR